MSETDTNKTDIKKYKDTKTGVDNEIMVWLTFYFIVGNTLF